MGDTLLEWLDSIQLSQWNYADVLRANGFTELSDLYRLNEESLVRIGITKRGHRMRMLQRLPKVTQPAHSSPVGVTSGITQPGEPKRKSPPLPPGLPPKTKSLDDKSVSLGHGLSSLPPPVLPPKQPIKGSAGTSRPDFDEEDYFVGSPQLPLLPRRDESQNGTQFDDPEYLGISKDHDKTKRTGNLQSSTASEFTEQSRRLPPPPPPVVSSEKPAPVAKPVLPPRPDGPKQKPIKPPRRGKIQGKDSNSPLGSQQVESERKHEMSNDHRPPVPIPRQEDVPPLQPGVAADFSDCHPPIPIPKQNEIPPFPHSVTEHAPASRPPIPNSRKSEKPPLPKSVSEDTVNPRPPLPIPKNLTMPPLPDPPIPKDDKSCDIQKKELMNDFKTKNTRPPMPLPFPDNQQRSIETTKDFFSEGQGSSSDLKDFSMTEAKLKEDTYEQPKKEVSSHPLPTPDSSVYEGDSDLPPAPLPSPVSRMPSRAPPPPPERKCQLTMSEATGHSTPEENDKDQENDDQSDSDEYVDMTNGGQLLGEKSDVLQPKNTVTERPQMPLPLPGMETVKIMDVVPPSPQITSHGTEMPKPPPEGEKVIEATLHMTEEESSGDPVQPRHLSLLPDDGNLYTVPPGNDDDPRGIYSGVMKNIKQKTDREMENSEIAYDVLVASPRERSKPVDQKKRVSNLMDLSPEVAPSGLIQPSVILPDPPNSAGPYHTTNVMDSDLPEVPSRGRFHSPPPDFPPPPPPTESLTGNVEYRPKKGLTTFGRPSSENIIDSLAPPPPPPRRDSDMFPGNKDPGIPHRPAPPVPTGPQMPNTGRVRPKPVPVPIVPDLTKRPPAIPPHISTSSRDSIGSNFSVTSLEPLRDENDESDILRGYDSDVSDSSDEQVHVEYDLRGPEQKRMSTLSTLSAYTPTERPTEKKGYLFKQGGKQRNRGWRKRWVVFNGKDLRYYGNEGDMVSKRIIPVRSMRNVETSVKSGDKPNRFFLYTNNRKFEFAAENPDEMSKWGSMLMERIIHCNSKRPDVGFPDGGDMFCPDKEGPVKMDGEKRYIVIKGAVFCYYVTHEDYKAASPISEITMNIATVKDVQKNKLTLVTPYQQHVLVFESNEEMKGWCEAMHEAIAEGLGDPKTLLYVSQNPSNKFCADCGAENPDWTSINLCNIICKQCAGHHRGLGVELSKVRSLKMDKLSPTVQHLLLKIGNENFNSVWEGKPNSANFKIKPTAEKDYRRIYIEKKYRSKHLFRYHEILVKDGIRALNEALVAASTSDDCLLEVAHMVYSGADPNYSESGPTAIDVAKENKQQLIMEFLTQNTGGCTTPSNTNTPENPQVPEIVDSPPQLPHPPNQMPVPAQSDPYDLNYTGFLHKTGGTKKEFQKRWCRFENGAFTYYVDDKATTPKNTLEARDILSVSCDNPDFALKLGHTYCFEIGTTSGRTYLFSADKQTHKRQWVKIISKSIAPNCVWDHLEDFDRAGSLYMKEGSAGHWQKTWFILRGKVFMYFSAVLMEMEKMDLRKLIKLSAQTEVTSEMSTEGANCVSAVVMPKRTLYFHADTKQENEEWFNAIRTEAMKSGKSLHEQQLTDDDVPVLVTMCIEYIALHGMSEEGIYRLAGQESKVKALLEDFSANARAVNLDDYPVHQVANALKRFFRNLPDPLFTKALYAEWIKVAGYTDHDSKLRWYKYYLDQLPPINKETLKKLTGHLIRVSKNSDTNKMVTKNLAAVWGPTLMASNTSNTGVGFNDTNNEIAVITDIITYYNWLFDVSEEEVENERQKEQRIAEGLEKLLHMQQQQQQQQMTGFLVGATFAGTELNVRVSPDATADQYLHKVITSHSLDPSRNYALFEVLCNGDVERPIHGSENVLQVTSSWGQDHKGAENSLCVKENYILPKWKNASDLLPFGTVKINSDKKSFKKLMLELQGKILRCFKDSKGTGRPEGEWCVDNMKIYVGGDQRKSPPTKFAFTCKIDNNKTRIVCVESDYELNNWIGALFKAKYPDGFSGSSAQGADGSVAPYQPQQPTLQLNVPFLSPDGSIRLKSPFRESMGKSRFEAFTAELHNKARKYSVRKKKH